MSFSACKLFSLRILELASLLISHKSHKCIKRIFGRKAVLQLLRILAFLAFIRWGKLQIFGADCIWIVVCICVCVCFCIYICISIFICIHNYISICIPWITYLLGIHRRRATNLPRLIVLLPKICTMHSQCTQIRGSMYNCIFPTKIQEIQWRYSACILLCWWSVFLFIWWCAKVFPVLLLRAKCISLSQILRRKFCFILFMQNIDRSGASFYWEML